MSATFHRVRRVSASPPTQSPGPAPGIRSNSETPGYSQAPRHKEMHGNARSRAGDLQPLFTADDPDRVAARIALAIVLLALAGMTVALALAAVLG